MLSAGAADFASRVWAHELATEEMAAGNLASVQFNGREMYAIKNQWIVALDLSATPQLTIRSAIENLEIGATIVHGLGVTDAALIEVPDGLGYAQITAALHDVPCRYVVPNGIMLVDSTPNDTQFSSQWSLNSGMDRDIDAPEAWDITQGTRDTVVGVIDTGVDYTHPDLYKNIWLNQGEGPQTLSLTDCDSDGLITFVDLNNPQNASCATDFDSDGRITANDLFNDTRWVNEQNEDDNSDGIFDYVDDLIGWNFKDYHDDPSLGNRPMDDYGHGTHVAGTIAAMGNNSLGVAGTTWNTQMMLLRVGSVISYADAAAAVRYATDMKQNHNVKIRVTNNSYGGWFEDGVDALYSAISGAHDAGMLFVASAGNDVRDNDGDPTGGDPIAIPPTNANYPATFARNTYSKSYPYNLRYAALDNVISVAATDRYDNLAYYSNHGRLNLSSPYQADAGSVLLGAPGVDILSTCPLSLDTLDGSQDGYTLMSGTSMAAPHVTGVIALALSASPTSSYQTIKNAIRDGVDRNESLYGKTLAGGRLNARRTLDLLQQQSVTGTANADTIVIRMNGTTVEAVVNGNAQQLSPVRWIKIDALGGNDTITVNNDVLVPVEVYGGDGNDTVTGGPLGDRLNGGEGTDNITGGSGDDSLCGGPGYDTLDGGAGQDMLRGDDGNDSLIGGAGSDTYAFRSIPGGTLGSDTVQEADYASSYLDSDLLDFSSFAEALDLDIGALSAMSVTSLTLTLSNTTAVEFAKGTPLGDAIDGNSSPNFVWGADGNDAISTLAGNDLLEGGMGDDTLAGGTGSDTFVFAGWYPGYDYITEQGWVDADTLDFSHSLWRVEVILPLASVLFRDGDATNYSMYFSDIEAIENVIGSNVHDRSATIDDVFYANRRANIFWGKGGNDRFYPEDTVAGGGDTFWGGSGNDTVTYASRTAGVTITLDGLANDGQTTGEGDNVQTDIEIVIGGNGPDLLIGDWRNQELDGWQGDDTIKGAGGADTLLGGGGNDLLFSIIDAYGGYTGDSEGDWIEGGFGDDTIHGGSAQDTLHGDTSAGGGTFDGNDVIYGEDNADTIFGNGGADSLYGDRADAYGAYGGDAIDGGDANDTIWGGGGNDTLLGQDGGDVLMGGEGYDVISGGEGDDWAYGGAGDDTISGDEGSDFVDGDDSSEYNAGNDVLDGGTGSDTVWGRAGNDVFHLHDYLSDTAYGGNGSDTVESHDGVDALFDMEIIR